MYILSRSLFSLYNNIRTRFSAYCNAIADIEWCDAEENLVVYRKVEKPVP